MASDALHLKPFVRITPENTHPDLPKEDKAIRPYSKSPSVTVEDKEAYKPETVGENSEFKSMNEASCISDINRRSRTVGDKGIEGYEKNTYSAYDVVILCEKLILAFWGVYGMVFYPVTECDAWMDEHTLEKTIEAEAEAEKRPEANIHKMVDAISTRTGKFRLQSVAKEPNDNVAHSMHHSLQGLSVNAELENKWPKNWLKVCWKKQRKKELSDLLGTFQTFHSVDPALLTAVVFPVSRQNITLSQGSDPQAPQETSGSAQRSQRQWPPDNIDGRPWALFRFELCRLSTFANLSPNFPVFAVQLAKTGFICLPNGTIVCYFCGVQRDQWQVGDSPEVVHRQLNPSCPLFTEVNCSNAPVTVPDDVSALMETWSLSGPPVPENILQSQAGAKPPGQASASPTAAATATGPQQVATDGSNPTSQNIAVSNNQAASDQTNLDTNTHTSNQQQSATGSRASTEGTASNAGPLPPGNATVRRIYDGTAQPETPGSVVQSPPSASETTGQKMVTYQELGIMTQAMKRTDMATVNARVGTFHSWPSTHTQTPMAMAEAGFYYAGYADCGRCFHCGGGLKNWEPVDNPWVEHARWFKNCDYVKQCKGQDFIDVIQDFNNRGNGEFTMDQVVAEMVNRRAGGYTINERTVDPAITSAQRVGYRQEAVDVAVQRLQADGNLLTLDRLMAYLEEDGAIAAGGTDNSDEVVDPDELEELVTSNSEIRQQRLCKICLDREVSIVFLPCGHFVCCTECSPPLRCCPMCRQRIKGRARAYPV